MPYHLELDYIKVYKLRCLHCKRDHLMEDARDLKLAQIIQPSPGGRGYGLCKFCRRPGLQVIDKKDNWD